MIPGNRAIQTLAEHERVDLTVAPSSHPDGLDLPLNDMPTLRFFFNLGVQRLRDILSSQQQQQQHPPTPPPAAATYTEGEPTARGNRPMTAHPPQLMGSCLYKIGSQSTGFKEEDIETSGSLQLPIGVDTPSASSSGSSTVSSACCSAVLQTPQTPNLQQQQQPALPSAPPWCANPIFNHSECRFTRAFHLQAEGESRRCHRSALLADATAAASQPIHLHRGPVVGETAEDEEEGTTAVEPALMVAYLNESLGRARRSLQHRGMPVVSTVDANGLQVDFSARPIDSIFQLARAKTEQERCRFDNFSRRPIEHHTVANSCVNGVKETSRMNGSH